MTSGRLAAAVAALLCTAGCGRSTRTAEGAPPPPPSAVPTTPSVAPVDALRLIDPSFHVVSRTPAFDAVSAEGRVFALDPEVRALRGFDLATGKELWSTPLGVAPSGVVKLHPSYGAAKRVLVHVQNQLLLFDAQSGALVARSGGPWSQRGTGLSVDRGTCMFATECEMFLVDCEDAHPYGPVLRSAVTHLYQSLGKPHDNVCWGARHLVGRGGNVVVAITDGLTFEVPDVAKTEGPITVGIDVTSGKTAWWTRAIGCKSCVTSGVSSDGSTCWLGDGAGRLDVFSCATGKLLFERKLGENALASSQPELFATWVAGGLLVSTKNEVVLLDPKSGKSLWSTPLPANGLGLPLGTELRFDAYSTWGARTVLLVDPKSGKEVTRFELPAYVELQQSPDLGLRVKGGLAFDAKGQKRTVAEAVPPFVLDRDGMPRRLRGGATVLAEVTTDLAIITARRTPSTDQVALFVWGAPGQVGELVFASRDR